MTEKPRKLGLLQRVRALDVTASRRQLARRGKDLASAAMARETAECQERAAADAEAAALALRNADPADPAALLHSRASACRMQDAATAVQACRSGEAEAMSAMDRARHVLVRAETRHDAIAARLRAEFAQLRRRAERRLEDDRLPARRLAWSLD